MNVQVVCFGEMLWDLLPSGEQPGGAPMNVAYHLQKQGLATSIISRVGEDEYGRRLRDILKGWKLPTQFVQQDKETQTGVVYAHPNEQHEVTYEIVQPVAWDFIEWEENMNQAVQSAEYFVYGSLSARSETSRKTLFRLLESANKRVFDINIRPPHFEKKLALELLRKVDILKLNENELPVLAEWCGAKKSFEEQVAAVQDHYAIPLLIVTRGGAGAVLRANGSLYSHPGYKVTVADTVGSGDAFLAGLLSQLKQGVLPGQALAFACATGAYIASRAGACPNYEVAAIEQLMKQG